MHLLLPSSRPSPKSRSSRLPLPPPAGGGTNGLAIASLIMGILGVLGLLACFGGVVGIPAVICGHMALGRIKRSGQGGRGLAIVGLVLGYLAIAGLIIGLLVGGLAIIFGESASQEFVEEMERGMERMQESVPPPESLPGEGG